MIQQLRRAKREQSGFTLIELLIVIVILGILAAVVVFAVNGIQDRGQQSACKADVSTVSIAAEAYNAQNGDYAPDMRTLVKAGLLKSEPSSKTYQVDYSVAEDGSSVDVSSTFCSGDDTSPSSSSPSTVVAAPYCEQLRAAVAAFGHGLDLNTLDDVGYGVLIKSLTGLEKAQPSDAQGVWTTFVATYTRAHQQLADAGLRWSNLSALLRGEYPNGISQRAADALRQSVSQTLNSSEQQQAYGTMINTSQSICGGDIFN